MEFLDEAATSWQRDIRLGQSRVIVPEEYLSVDPLTSTATFDLNKEIFCPIQVDPAVDANGAKPFLFQPTIRHEEHKATINETIARIVSNAGYAMQTFGDGDGTASSATAAAALKVRERKSLMTKGRKERYWGTAVEYIMQRMLAMDAQTSVPYCPVAEFGDSFAPDLVETATALELLERSNSASTDTKVAILHPEWDDAQKQEEVNKINRNTEAPALPDISNPNDIMNTGG
jgi:hypothetical protein